MSIVGFDGRYIDVRGAKAGDGTPLIMYPCHLGANQKFERREGMLVEKQSGKCLTTSWGKDRNAIYIDECSGRREQHWASQAWEATVSRRRQRWHRARESEDLPARLP